MKNTFLIIVFLLTINEIGFGQVTNLQNGLTYTIISTPVYADPGTTAYEYNPSGPGLYRVVRISNKWVTLYIDSGVTYLSNMSTLSYFENILPCNYETKSGTNSSSDSFQWTPSTTLPTLTGTILTFNLNFSGACSFAPSQGLVANPTNLQLPVLSSTPITTTQSFAGQLIYTGPDGALKYNNGASWRSLWPNNDSEYPIENWQRFKFGNSGYIRNSGGAGVTMGFNSDKLTVKNEGVDLNSSIRVPVRTTNVNTTLNLNDHIVIVSGNTSTITITLPPASSGQNKGLVYKILNHSASSVTISPTIVTGTTTTLTTLNSNTNVTVIADGANWRKVAD